MDKVLQLGVTGVDFFFLISGFVIFISLNSSKNALDFLRKRVFRLFPEYILSVLFTGIAVIFLDETNVLNLKFVGKWLSNFTMFQFYFGYKDLDSSYWTLRVEWLFYFLMALLYAKGKLSQLPKLIRMAVPILILYDVLVSNYFWNIFIIINKYVMLLPHIPLFFMGVLMYEVIQKRNVKENLFYIFLLFVLQFMYFDNGGKSMHILRTSQYMLMLVVYVSAFLLFVKGHLNFLNQKFLVFLGTISYPLYLVQMKLAILITSKLLFKVTSNVWIQLVMHLVVIFLFTFIIYYLSNWFRQKIKPRVRVK